MNSKITDLRLQPHLPGAIELTPLTSLSWESLDLCQCLWSCNTQVIWSLYIDLVWYKCFLIRNNDLFRFPILDVANLWRGIRNTKTFEVDDVLETRSIVIHLLHVLQKQIFVSWQNREMWPYDRLIRHAVSKAAISGATILYPCTMQSSIHNSFEQRAPLDFKWVAVTWLRNKVKIRILVPSYAHQGDLPYFLPNPHNKHPLVTRQR